MSVEQPAHINVAFRYVRLDVVKRVGVPAAASGCTSARSCVSVPSNCPAEVICGLALEPAAAFRFSTQKSPSGACGASFCQAATTLLASDHGHASEYVATSATGCVLKTSRVTMPKFPPPPPRRAQ